MGLGVLGVLGVLLGGVLLLALGDCDLTGLVRGLFTSLWRGLSGWEDLFCWGWGGVREASSDISPSSSGEPGGGGHAGGGVKD